MWHRKPVVAGSFYPSHPEKLSSMIDSYLQSAERKKLSGEIIGLLSPHAGYIYSGSIAAYSYVQLMESGVEVALVLAPSHRARFEGASVIPSGIYETPLGPVEIDPDIGERLAGEKRFGFHKDVDMAEHSLEVQVPFLQKVLKRFTLVPLIIGSIDIAICREIAGKIYEVIKNEKRKLVIIMSTDLSHYFPYEKASRMDGQFIDYLARYDEEELSRVLRSDRVQACGEGPVLTGLFLGRKLGADRVEVLKYGNSGDTAGGRDQVVGYLSAAIIKS